MSGLFNRLKQLKIERDDAIFVAIDFQEKLMPAMAEREELETKVVKLVSGMKALGIPTIVTQQYTKGLGATVPAVAEALGEFTPIDKTTFSCMGNEEFIASLEALDRGTVILAGIEAHICVEQTALALLAEGYEVALVTDCIQSRDPKNKEIAIKRMTQAGVIPTSFESVLYELLGGAKAPEFKAISALVK